MEKILTFIVRNNKLLLLLGNENDPQFHNSFWYVVTGGCEEKDKNLIETVKREVKEETNLNLLQIIDLNWKFEYESLGKHCIEYAFISYADNSEIKLNEENIRYKWCTLSEFIEKINWYDDKNILKEKLEKYL